MEERRERVRILLEWFKKNQIFKSNRAIAAAMGYNPCVISHVITGKINVAPTFLKALSETYPGINYDWLLQGQGEMLLNSMDTSERFDPNGIMLDRYTYVLMEVVKTMRSVSLLIDPINQEISRLKTQIEEQKKEINSLKTKIKKIESKEKKLWRTPIKSN